MGTHILFQAPCYAKVAKLAFNRKLIPSGIYIVKIKFV
jgi:hypothetical protein